MSVAEDARGERMIRVKEHGTVVEIVLDRPARANALTRAGVRELRSAVAGIREGVELILVRGAGGRAFCGGADSREMVSLPAEERRHAITELGRCVTELWKHPAMSVAVLDGYATGGGAHLALACGMRAATDAAWLQFPSASYGLSLGAVWLSQLCGPARAARLLGSGRRVSAAEAMEMGIVQAISTPDGAIEALGLIDAVGLRELKAAIMDAASPHVEAALDREHERAAEFVMLDRFVSSLSGEPSLSPSS